MQILSDIMDFDHVIMITDDGAVTDAPATAYAPMLTMGTTEDGDILDEHEADYTAQADLQGWAILSGCTGQYGYHGLCMHASEYIGGALEAHIRATPGLWVAVTVDTLDGDSDSWALAYRPAA